MSHLQRAFETGPFVDIKKDQNLRILTWRNFGIAYPDSAFPHVGSKEQVVPAIRIEISDGHAGAIVEIFESKNIHKLILNQGILKVYTGFIGGYF